MKKPEKTNVMRVLESKKIAYTAHEYEPDATLTGVQIAAIFGAREDSRPLSGDALKDAVRESFEARRGELRGVVDAG